QGPEGFSNGAFWSIKNLQVAPRTLVAQATDKGYGRNLFDIPAGLDACIQNFQQQEKNYRDGQANHETKYVILCRLWRDCTARYHGWVHYPDFGGGGCPGNVSLGSLLHKEDVQAFQYGIPSIDSAELTFGGREVA